jgi:hypothetical protein
MAANNMIMEFRDMMPTSLLDGYDRFVGTTASFFSVRQDVGDFRLLRYIQQPPTKRPSPASLHYCLSPELLR